MSTEPTSPRGRVERGRLAALDAWRDGRLSLVLALAGAPFGETFVLPGVTIADLALLLAAGAALLAPAGASSEHRVHRGLLVVAALLVGWALLDAACVARTAPWGLSPGELARSLAKLVFYLGGSCLLARWWDGRPEAARWLCDALLTVLAIHAAIGIYGAAAASSDWGLPHRFLAGLTPRGDTGTTLPGIPGLHRIRGLAGEATYFGWFQASGLGIVLLAGGSTRRFFAARVALVSLAIVGSLSLVGIGILGIALLLATVSRRRRPPSLLGPLVAAIAICLVAALLLPPVRGALRVGLRDRVANLAAGRPDPSSAVHLIGSWELASQVLAVSPWLGSGLGNYDLALDALGAAMTADRRAAGEIGWNGYAVVVGSLGPLGLLLFLGFLGILARRDGWLAALFATSVWGNSTVLGAPFWVLYLFAGMVAAPLMAAAAARPAAASAARPPG